MKDLINRIFVSLFKIPWIKARWAQSFQVVSDGTSAFQPLKKPLSQCRMALITTAGVHLKSDQPFDMVNVQGDGSLRIIPWGTAPDELTITHKYYDHTDADRDLGVVLPIQPLVDAVGTGRIGEIGPSIYSYMGHITDRQLDKLHDKCIPRLIKRLLEEGIDCCFLTPA